MTATLEQINNIIDYAHGTEQYHKRSYYNSLVYTDSIMELQIKCDMMWFVDHVISHMPAVIKDMNETDNTFYVVEISADDSNRGLFLITKEEYDEEGNYIDKNVVYQEIPYVDLPECKLKFFLELANYEPVVYCLMCPSDR